MSNFVCIPPNFFCDFSFISIVFINIHEYSNLIICVRPLGKIIVSWHQFGIMFGTLEQLTADILYVVNSLSVFL